MNYSRNTLCCATTSRWPPNVRWIPPNFTILLKSYLHTSEKKSGNCLNHCSGCWLPKNLPVWERLWPMPSMKAALTQLPAMCRTPPPDCDQGKKSTGANKQTSSRVLLYRWRGNLRLNPDCTGYGKYACQSSSPVRRPPADRMGNGLSQSCAPP